jgi:hypothetical protein
MTTMTLAKVLALSAILSPTLSEAQTNRNCAPRSIIVERLADKYGETRRGMGLGNNNSVVEIFASAESGTWTIIVSMTNGISCLVSSGQAYEAVADALPPKGEKL